MKKLLSTCLFMALSATIMAIPAKRGVWKTLTLADGTTVEAQLTGDEFGHCWRAIDGKAYRTYTEGVYQAIDFQQASTRAKARRNEANAKRMKRLPGQKKAATYTGQKKGIIVLVNFSDRKFQTAHDNALYQRIANEEGFSKGNFKGSMVDYFKAQSLGKFELDFDIVGPVTVSKSYAYYGKNDSDDNDMYPGLMVCEAVTLAKSQVNDWSQYDWDGDGEVDQIYVVYAGKGEADGGAANTIWPHAYDLASAKQFGDGTGPVTVATGLTVNTYACGPELNGQNGDVSGIGTMCHEFSHCLGYPDFYDIDYSGGQGMGEWDLMDNGSYNGDGYQPAGYTSWERWEAGWETPTTLEDEDVSVEGLEALQTSGKSYIIYNKGNRNEYFLLENRQQVGWDASLPEGGLLIVHCDYDADVWYMNQPNDNPSHQRMTCVPADGKFQYETYMGEKYYYSENDVFPYGSVKAFNKNFKATDTQAKNAAKLFNKNTNGTYYIDSSVEDITQNVDGTIAFKFVASYGSNSGSGGEPTEDGVLFYESFDECDDTGGNDGLWSGQNADGTFTPDNDGWVAEKAFGANQCAKFGTGKVTGSATTPSIILNGEAKLTFRAGAWNSSSDNTTLLLEVSGGTISPATVTMAKGAFTDFEATISASDAVTITSESLKGRFFLDEVKVTTTTATSIGDALKDSGEWIMDKTIYDLQGRRVSTGQGQKPTAKGLYIVGGKKMVIR